jgi:hypothetical protein
MSATSQHPTVSVGATATLLSRVMPNHSIISLRDPKTNTQGPEWEFDRVEGADGTIYLPHGPVNPSEFPEDLPLTATSPFFSDLLRNYIAKQQTQFSKDPGDWYLEEIEPRGPQSEGVAKEDAVHLRFGAPLAEGPFWRMRSQFRYLKDLTANVLLRTGDRSVGTSRGDSVS